MSVNRPENSSPPPDKQDQNISPSDLENLLAPLKVVIPPQHLALLVLEGPAQTITTISRQIPPGIAARLRQIIIDEQIR